MGNLPILNPKIWFSGVFGTLNPTVLVDAVDESESDDFLSKGDRFGYFWDLLTGVWMSVRGRSGCSRFPPRGYSFFGESQKVS